MFERMYTPWKHGRPIKWGSAHRIEDLHAIFRDRFKVYNENSTEFLVCRMVKYVQLSAIFSIASDTRHDLSE